MEVEGGGARYWRGKRMVVEGDAILEERDMEDDLLQPVREGGREGGGTQAMDLAMVS